MSTVRIPYNFEPEPHQLPVLAHPARNKVIVWHRRGRKTTMAINELIRRAYAKRGVYAYVAPYRDQAKKIVWDNPDMLQRYVPPDVWASRNNSELKLALPNGSIVYFLGGENPDNLRGLNLMGVVFDEYADMRPEVWLVVKPILAGNGGWCWFIGTPKGQNDFKVKRDYAKYGGDKAWAAFELKASESGIIGKDELDSARREMPQAIYDQEFEIQFLDSAGQFFRRVRQNAIPAVDNPMLHGHKFQLGVDLAKYVDWTVLTAIDLHTFKVRPQERFNQIDWNLQRARVEAFSLRHGGGKAYVDQTGVGDPIVEDLAKAINCEGVKFTEASRLELLTNLAVKLERDIIKLPMDEGLLTELESFRYELSDRGKIRVQVPAGCTDDRVMSLALAVKDLPERPLTLRTEDRHAQEAFDRFAAIL